MLPQQRWNSAWEVSSVSQNKECSKGTHHQKNQGTNGTLYKPWKHCRCSWRGSEIWRNRHKFPRHPQRIPRHPPRWFRNSRLAGVFWVWESTDPRLSTDTRRVVLKGRKWNKPAWLAQQYWVQIPYTNIAFQIIACKSALIGSRIVSCQSSNNCRSGKSIVNCQSSRSAPATKFAGGRVEAKAAPRGGQITPQTMQATTPAPNGNCQDGGLRASLRCGWTMQGDHYFRQPFPVQTQDLSPSPPPTQPRPSALRALHQFPESAQATPGLIKVPQEPRRSEELQPNPAVTNQPRSKPNIFSP